MRLLNPLRRLWRNHLLPPPGGSASVIALDQRMHDLVAPTTEIERICTRLGFTEGPVWIAEREALYFSDIRAGRLLEWKNARLRIVRRKSGHANGNARDGLGRLLTCEHSGRRVVRTDAGGQIEVLASHWRGRRLNSPNDIVVKSDGSIYFTDPPFGIRHQQAELGFAGIYRISPDGKLKLLSDVLAGPNGLAFSLDEKHLFVDDSTTKTLHRFSLTTSGLLEDQRIVLDMDNGMRGNPDGMKLDAEGNLFIAGPGGIWVVSTQMKQLGLIQLPELPSNCAWGDDGHNLYVTARRSVYRMTLKTSGAIAARWAQ